jgi:hypothetical protein
LQNALLQVHKNSNKPHVKQTNIAPMGTEFIKQPNILKVIQVILSPKMLSNVHNVENAILDFLISGVVKSQNALYCVANATLTNLVNLQTKRITKFGDFMIKKMAIIAQKYLLIMKINQSYADNVISSQSLD